MLIDKIIQVNVVEGGHENIVPNDFDLKPEEGQPTTEGEVESVGLVMNYVRNLRP